MARPTVPRRKKQRKRTTRDRPVPTKSITGRKFTWNPMRVVTGSGCGHKRQVSQRSLLTCGKDPMLWWPSCPKSGTSCLRCPIRVRWSFCFMTWLKRYETLWPEETLARKRPTPCHSANFFDAPEMHVEDEAFWANNREGFNHDPGPRQEFLGKMPRRNRVVVEPLVNPLGRNRGLRRQSDAVETYGATEIEARMEEEAANLPSEAEGRPSGEPAMVYPVMEWGTTDVGRPVRLRRPPVRVGIDELVS